MAGQWAPLPPRTFLADTSATIYRGMPVVAKSGTAETVTTPAGDRTDFIIGVALEDAGASAYGNAVNNKEVAVQMWGVVQMVAKGSITAMNPVKIGPTITATPPGAPQSETQYTAQALSRASAGAQPYPQLGIALNGTSADGDVVYVLLTPGAQL